MSRILTELELRLQSAEANLKEYEKEEHDLQVKLCTATINLKMQENWLLHMN